MNSLHHKNPLAPSQLVLHGKPRTIVQPKLTINAPGDEYEQEADAMAEKVMQMPFQRNSHEPSTGIIGASVQRKCASCEEEDNKQKPIMRKPNSGAGGIQATDSLALSLNAKKGGGSPIPQGTRNFMENAFSTDFSKVRLHTDGQAAEMSKEINAKAFTHGNDVYFGSGEYQPNTDNGKHLLAHELVHVGQQSGENRLRNPKKNDLIQRNPALTRAAEAAQVVSSIISAGSLSVTADEMEGWHYAPNVTPPASGTRQISSHRVRFTFLLESLLTFDIYRVRVKMDYETDGSGVGNISFSVEDKLIDSLYSGSLVINLTKSDISLGTLSSIRLSFDYSLSGNILTGWSNESGNYSHIIYSDSDIRPDGYISDDMTERMRIVY